MFIFNSINLKKKKLVKADYKRLKSYKKLIEELETLAEQDDGRNLILERINTLLGLTPITNVVSDMPEINEIINNLDELFRCKSSAAITDYNTILTNIHKKTKKFVLKMLQTDEVNFNLWEQIHTITNKSSNPQDLKQRILQILKKDYTFVKTTKNKLDFELLRDFVTELDNKVFNIHSGAKSPIADFTFDFFLAQIIRGTSIEIFLQNFPFLTKEILDFGPNYNLSFPFLYNKIALFRLDKDFQSKLDNICNPYIQGNVKNQFIYDFIKSIFQKKNFKRYFSYYSSDEYKSSIIWSLACLNGPDKKLHFMSVQKTTYLYPSFFSCYNLPLSLASIFSYYTFTAVDLPTTLNLIIENSKELAFLANNIELKKFFEMSIRLKITNVSEVHSIADILKIIYNLFVYEFNLINPEDWKDGLINQHKLMTEPNSSPNTHSSTLFQKVSSYLHSFFIERPALDSTSGTSGYSTSTKSWLALICFSTGLLITVYVKTKYFPN